eukprot:Rhum_TRINITY_DN25761_c0_g1::Rhum_TRINITY_DN25761_c0_g1_i1::g.182724::m.182724
MPPQTLKARVHQTRFARVPQHVRHPRLQHRLLLHPPQRHVPQQRVVRPPPPVFLRPRLQLAPRRLPPTPAHGLPGVPPQVGEAHARQPTLVLLRADVRPLPQPCAHRAAALHKRLQRRPMRLEEDLGQLRRQLRCGGTLVRFEHAAPAVLQQRLVRAGDESLRRLLAQVPVAAQRCPPVVLLAQEVRVEAPKVHDAQAVLAAPHARPHRPQRPLPLHGAPLRGQLLLPHAPPQVARPLHLDGLPPLAVRDLVLAPQLALAVDEGKPLLQALRAQTHLLLTRPLLLALPRVRRRLHVAPQLPEEPRRHRRPRGPQEVVRLLQQRPPTQPRPPELPPLRERLPHRRLHRLLQQVAGHPVRRRAVDVEADAAPPSERRLEGVLRRQSLASRRRLEALRLHGSHGRLLLLLRQQADQLHQAVLFLVQPHQPRPHQALLVEEGRRLLHRRPRLRLLPPHRRRLPRRHPRRELLRVPTALELQTHLLRRRRRLRRRRSGSSRRSGG